MDPPGLCLHGIATLRRSAHFEENAAAVCFFRCLCPGVGGVFLLEVQYSILKSLISTCVLSYVGSREDWLLDRICESKKDCWDSIRRTSYPYQ